MERDLTVSGRARALAVMEAAYASAGITRFAAWVHEGDQAMREDLQARDYALAESTRAMGMDLSDLRVPRPAITLAAPRWSEYLRILGVPPGFARRADRDLFHVLIAAPDGVGVAAAMAEGIYAALGFRDLGRILEYVPPGDG